MNNYRIMQNGIKQESTGYRPLNYSRWHRNLAKHCYAYDIDMIEYRSGRGIVGIFEIKQFKTVEDMQKYRDYVIKQSEKQIHIYKLLASAGTFKIYYVMHTQDMKHFEVWNISVYPRPTFKIYTEEQYKIWLENL